MFFCGLKWLDISKINVRVLILHICSSSWMHLGESGKLSVLMVLFPVAFCCLDVSIKSYEFHCTSSHHEKSTSFFFFDRFYQNSFLLLICFMYLFQKNPIAGSFTNFHLVEKCIHIKESCLTADFKNAILYFTHTSDDVTKPIVHLKDIVSLWCTLLYCSRRSRTFYKQLCSQWRLKCC